MSSSSDIRSAIDTATAPDQAELERARMIVVDKLGEWDSLGLDEIIESVCEAYESPSGEPLRVADVDPTAPDADSPALRNLRYARAARTAVIELERGGTLVSVPEHPGDAEEVTGTGPVDDDDEAATAAAKQTTARAAERADAEEVILSTGPQPRGRRFSLART